MKKSLIWIVAAIAATAFAADARADRGHGRGRGLGHWIGRPPMSSHRRVIVAPRRPVFVPLGPRVVVTPPPPVVVAPPSRTVIIRPAPVVIEPSTVTVWITNANGSQSPVELKRQGPGYIGPRGEYYSEMPTQEQLRIVYGLGPLVTPSDTVTVYIQNSAGGVTPITLKKNGEFYVGPAGEYYPALPTAEQLQMIYADTGR